MNILFHNKKEKAIEKIFLQNKTGQGINLILFATNCCLLMYEDKQVPAHQLKTDVALDHTKNALGILTHQSYTRKS